MTHLATLTHTQYPWRQLSPIPWIQTKVGENVFMYTRFKHNYAILVDRVRRDTYQLKQQKYHIYAGLMTVYDSVIYGFYVFYVL